MKPWHGLTKKLMIWSCKVDDRVFENLQNIRQNHKLHQKCPGKMKGGIDSGMSNPSRGKYPKRYLKRFALATAIRYSNDATQPKYLGNVRWGRLQMFKNAGKD